MIAAREADLPAFAKLLGTRLGGIASMRQIRFRNGMIVQRVLAQRPEGEIMIDLMLARDAFLQGALARRIRRDVPGFATTYVASVEDLVIMKLAAGRPQDLVDTINLLDEHSVDRDYLEIWAATLRIRGRLHRMLRRRDRRRP